MSDLLLVDSSGWIQFLRRNGEPTVRERVEKAVFQGRAAWCQVVRLELWRGAKGKSDREDVMRLERDLPMLDISSDVWDLACMIADRARAAGTPVPTPDIIIYACAKHHMVDVIHFDRHYDLLDQLKLV